MKTKYDELAELEGKAAKGPWREATRGPNNCPILSDEHGLIVAMLCQGEEFPGDETAAFIVAARNAVPTLIADVKALAEALAAYANPDNWEEDENGIRRVWLEPGSTTPDRYEGFESARAALARIQPIEVA